MFEINLSQPRFLRTRTLTLIGLRYARSQGKEAEKTSSKAVANG